MDSRRTTRETPLTTRDRILDAAAEVMHTRGLARATTKEIAKQAGLSEATLYKHFHDKVELFVDVLRERLPRFAPPPDQAGKATVEENLRDIARAAIAFYDRSFPMAASTYSEPGLLAAFRAAIAQQGVGPHLVNSAVAAYLRDEQRLGRVARDADPEAAAALLLGGCLQCAFFRHFTDAAPFPDPDEAATALARTLGRGLLPPA